MISHPDIKMDRKDVAFEIFIHGMKMYVVLVAITN
jgi:hypothetical protein